MTPLTSPSQASSLHEPQAVAPSNRGCQPAPDATPTPVVSNGLSAVMRTAAQLLFCASAFVGRTQAQGGDTGSVSFDPPPAGVPTPGLKSSGLVERAIATACEATNGDYKIIVTNNKYALEDLALENAVLKGALEGCWQDVNFHHPTQNAAPEGNPVEAVLATYGNAARDAQNAAGFARALLELRQLLDSHAAHVSPITGMDAGVYNFSAFVQPSGRVDVGCMPTSSAVSKVCPVGPEPGKWYLVDPWWPGRQPAPITGDMTYAKLRSGDAFDRAQMHTSTGLAFLDRDMDSRGATREHRHAYWTGRNHLLVELTHAIGPENVTLVQPISMLRAYRNMAANVPGVHLVEPTGQNPPAPADLCSHAAKDARAKSTRREARIEDLTRRLVERGVVEKILIAGDHASKLELVNSVAQGVKSATVGTKPIPFWRNTGCESIWKNETHVQRAERFVKLDRISTPKGVPFDTAQEAAFLSLMEEGFEIEPFTPCFEHASGSLAEFARKPGLAIANVLLWQAFSNSTQPDLLDESWRQQKSEAIPSEERVPVHLEGPDRELAVERQRDLYGGLALALQHSRGAVAFVDGQALARRQVSPGAFNTWCIAQRWVPLTLPLSDGTSTIVVSTPKILFGQAGT